MKLLLGIALGVAGCLLLYVYYVRKGSAGSWYGNIHEVEDHAVDEFEEMLERRDG